MSILTEGTWSCARYLYDRTMRGLRLAGISPNECNGSRGTGRGRAGEKGNTIVHVYSLKIGTHAK